MWQKLKTFITVADLQSFAKAARKMNLSTPTVTRYIQELEKEYKTNLFHRSTRQVVLSDSGSLVYQQTLELLQVQQQTLEQLHHQDDIEGAIKIGLPHALLHHFVSQTLPTLKQQYPKLKFELIQGNHIFSILNQQFDLAIHCGPLPECNLQYKKLGQWQKMLLASPKYLAQYGTPKSIDDLKKHSLIDHADNHTHCWPLLKNGKDYNQAITSDLRINNAMELASAAAQGLGIAYLPSFCAKQLIENKQLIPILKETWSPKLDAFAVYPGRKIKSQKVTLMIEKIADIFTVSTMSCDK